MWDVNPRGQGFDEVFSGMELPLGNFEDDGAVPMFIECRLCA